jgi:hypothetical protein
VVGGGSSPGRPCLSAARQPACQVRNSAVPAGNGLDRSALRSVPAWNPAAQAASLVLSGMDPSKLIAALRSIGAGLRPDRAACTSRGPGAMTDRSATIRSRRKRRPNEEAPLGHR